MKGKLEPTESFLGKAPMGPFRFQTLGELVPGDPDFDGNDVHFENQESAKLFVYIAVLFEGFRSASKL